MLFKRFDKNPYAPLAVKEFRYFVCGRAVFMMGIRMTVTIIGWWMYELTNSKLALGFVGLSEIIPALSLALYAGHYIDLHEKRRLLLRGLLMYIGCILCCPIIKIRCGSLRALEHCRRYVRNYCGYRRHTGF
ncbi:MAG TPA: MFS transporter [Ferruginibacter sp.]|nr:MFS transporter [Ferruginibacter sp.]